MNGNKSFEVYDNCKIQWENGRLLDVSYPKSNSISFKSNGKSFTGVLSKNKTEIELDNGSLRDRSKWERKSKKEKEEIERQERIKNENDAKEKERIVNEKRKRSKRKRTKFKEKK
jgi:hypothetical protein